MTDRVTTSNSEAAAGIPPASNHQDPGSESSESTTIDCENSRSDGLRSLVPEDVNRTKNAAAETEQHDPESLQPLPRRTTLRDSLKRVGTTLSEKVPPHWRKNYLREGRNSQRIDDHPDGYPRFAAFMNSDENFLVARRYGLLHTRVMLYRQAELAELEQELLDLDKDDAAEKDRALRGVKFLRRGEKGGYREELISKTEEKLKQYDDIVMRHRAMSALPSASTRNYCSVGNYLYHNAPLSSTDQELFSEDTDFAALVDPKEAVSFDGFIEDCLSMVPCRLTKLMFATPEQRASTDDKHVHLYSKSRIDTFVRLIITLLAVALLMAPVVVLFVSSESQAVKILIILLFTLGFSVALSMFTKAQRQEVFAATAA